MERYLQSYTIVPEEHYVERSADRQIVNVIKDMGRPGYVLVPRQMGKTNLLLHAKKKMADDKNIFVYIDFSSIPIYDDRAFFELLINKAVEEGKEIFGDAKNEIDKLRKERLYDSVNRYTAELLKLLHYVDRLVFVLDEIDALTKSKYSDSIFSQIRSDYFQRVNYKDLYKVTYILSGVFEPKDLIKDPNISPFNIGEKIYLRSFNKSEVNSFIDKANLSFSEEVKDKIFYWTNGHPRMINDICRELQYIDHPTVTDIDEVVFHCYLEAFDKPPIDGIRRNVEADSILQDAAIQLLITPENLSIDLKQKLYLAGIGDYQGAKFVVRNPIVKEALPIEWLKRLSEKKRDVLTTAFELIYLDKKYNEAIAILDKYVSLGDADLLQLNHAYYYLGLCYFRKYDTEESQRNLERINTEVGKDGFEIVMQSYLIMGYNYSNMSNHELCLQSYNLIIDSKKDVNKELYAKAYIGKVDALARGTDEELRKARKLMQSFIDSADIDNYYGYRAISYYEMSAIEERLGNPSKAFEYIEDAIQYAESSEIPTLLYNKLMLVKDKKEQQQTIENLLSYLKSYDKKPEIEDFDKMLSLNYYNLACMMAEILLYHNEYTKSFEPYLKWFNSSKESAYNSIMKHLRNFDDEHALPFAQMILKLSEETGWLFGSDHIFNALSTVFQFKPNTRNALVLYKYIEENNYTDNRKEVAWALLKVTKEFINTEKLDKAQKVVDFFRTQFAVHKDTLVNALSVIIDYYDTIIQIRKGDVEKAQDYTDRFIVKTQEMTDGDYDLIRPMGREDIQKLQNDLKVSLLNLQVALRPRIPIVKERKFGQNELVVATYFGDGRVVTTKFKKVKSDYEKKLCSVEKK